MTGGGEGEGTTLEFTPTWVVAGVCTVIVFISLAVERLIHYVVKYLKPLQPLDKVQQELMLGFTALLLTIFENSIVKICVHEHVMHSLLPCSYTSRDSAITSKIEESVTRGYCAQKNKVPLLSAEAIQHLQIFMFVLAIVHVTCSILAVVLGQVKIRQWKHWEDSVSKDDLDAEKVSKPKASSCLAGWLESFFKQFYGSVTKSDYIVLRQRFILTHCRGNPSFSFHEYMIRASEDDFKKVVGISWYLWIFVVIFLLINVHGWHMYFWSALIPFTLLIAVSTKLEHIMSQLANEVVEKHIVTEDGLLVKSSDNHFWFHQPRIIFLWIHFIMFQNAFEIAFFLWILFQYSFDSCMMGQARYIVPRLIIGVIIQVLCSYSTLPIYALVTQMGTNYKKTIFDEHIQAALVDAKCEQVEERVLGSQEV